MEYEIKPQKKLSLGLGELWEYRELFYFFTWRDIKVKYKQTYLGVLWALLQPLGMMLIFTFLFSQGANRIISSDEMSTMISIGKEKLRESILRNNEISQGKRAGVKSFVISLSPTAEDLVKDKAIGNYGNFLSSSAQEANLNARLNKVYAEGNLECYIILINAFDVKIIKYVKSKTTGEISEFSKNGIIKFFNVRNSGYSKPEPIKSNKEQEPNN